MWVSVSSLQVGVSHPKSVYTAPAETWLLFSRRDRRILKWFWPLSTGLDRRLLTVVIRTHTYVTVFLLQWQVHIASRYLWTSEYFSSRYFLLILLCSFWSTVTSGSMIHNLSGLLSLLPPLLSEPICLCYSFSVAWGLPYACHLRSPWFSSPFWRSMSSVIALRVKPDTEIIFCTSVMLHFSLYGSFLSQPPG